MNNQTQSALKKPSFLLTLLIIAFIFKGLFLSALTPIFQGYDEHKHFSRTEYLLEPTKKTWPIKKMLAAEYDAVRTEYDISTFHYSEDITNTAQKTQFDETRQTSVNSPFLSTSASGPEEQTILNSGWKRYIDLYPATMAGHPKANYLVPTLIDKALYNQSIFVRFFSIRLFSTFLGCLILLLAFHVARKIGFAENNSLLFTGLIAFQPAFSALTAIISNDPLLITVFSLYTFAAVSIIKDQLNLRNGLILLLTVIGGLLIKAPAVVLVIVSFPLLLFAIQRKWQIRKSRLLLGSMFLIIALGLLIYWLFPSSLSYSTGIGRSTHFDSLGKSLSRYWDETSERFEDSGFSYWGNFGWLELPIAGWILRLIWIIEGIAFVGLLLYFFTKKKRPYLPSRLILLFCLLLFLALQFAIRFYDWNVFNQRGWILANTHGRYFMPVIIAHFLLIVTGLGFWLKTEKNFNLMLKTLFVGMALLQVYSIFNVIIPRYYF